MEEIVRRIAPGNNALQRAFDSLPADEEAARYTYQAFMDSFF